MTKLIVGLGNPGEKYANSRHNLGFRVIDQTIVGKMSSPEVSKKLQSIVYKIEDTLYLKPQTFMNLSGRAVRAAVDFYKIPLENLLVIHDDVDFEMGEIKHQYDRSSAGNNGVESIITELGSQSFHRLRLGIGRGEEPKIETSDFVLQNFSENEKKTVEKMVLRASEVTENWVKTWLKSLDE